MFLILFEKLTPITCTAYNFLWGEASDFSPRGLRRPGFWLFQGCWAGRAVGDVWFAQMFPGSLARFWCGGFL